VIIEEAIQEMEHYKLQPAGTGSSCFTHLNPEHISRSLEFRQDSHRIGSALGPLSPLDINNSHNIPRPLSGFQEKQEFIHLHHGQEDGIVRLLVSYLAYLDFVPEVEENKQSDHTAVGLAGSPRLCLLPVQRPNSFSG
jgi:hypothetical protein